MIPLWMTAIRQLLFQRLEFPGPLDHGEVAGEHGDPGRVVSPVFETMEPLEDDGERLVGTNVADDPAHERDMVPARGLPIDARGPAASCVGGRTRSGLTDRRGDGSGVRPGLVFR